MGGHHSFITFNGYHLRAGHWCYTDKTCTNLAPRKAQNLREDPEIAFQRDESITGLYSSLSLEEVVGWAHGFMEEVTHALALAGQ